MSQQSNDPGDKNFARAKMNLATRAQFVDAVKRTTHGMTLSARYMFWTAIVCTTSSVITVIAVLYGVLVVLPRTTH
jgi:hypothetical protein